MRINVTFKHPAEFVGTYGDGGGVLAVDGAHWFAVLLQRVQGLQLNEDLCQADWGVVYFAHASFQATPRSGTRLHQGLLSESSAGYLRRHLLDMADRIAGVPERRQ